VIAWRETRSPGYRSRHVPPVDTCDSALEAGAHCGRTLPKPRFLIFMKIAQVSPLFESTPPKSYGGIERVVAFLTDELTTQGHEVTLFATADSTAKASRLIPGAERGLRSEGCRDPMVRHLAMLETVSAMAAEFDIIHFHLDYLHMPLARVQHWPHVTTLHGRLDQTDLKILYRHYSDLPLVSISDAQRVPIPDLDWYGTVYNGQPLNLQRFCPAGGEYLAFVGRMNPDKGVEEAIAIARAAGMPLKLAAKIDNEWKPYFEEKIQPLLKKSDTEFVGEIGDAEKTQFLGNARGLIFPIKWPEPFGLVMIEAMACGTPVVAFPMGAVPEVVAEGVSGFVVGSIDAAVEAVGQLDQIDRRRCRAHFERRFSAERMAEGYLKIYRRIKEQEGEAKISQNIAKQAL